MVRINSVKNIAKSKCLYWMNRKIYQSIALAYNHEICQTKVPGANCTGAPPVVCFLDICKTHMTPTAPQAEHRPTSIYDPTYPIYDLTYLDVRPCFWEAGVVGWPATGPGAAGVLGTGVLAGRATGRVARGATRRWRRGQPTEFVHRLILGVAAGGAAPVLPGEGRQMLTASDCHYLQWLLQTSSCVL